MKQTEFVIYKKGSEYVENFISNSLSVSDINFHLSQDENLTIVPFDIACKRIEKIHTKKYCLKPWIEINKGEWWEMLEVLPPENWIRSAYGHWEGFRMMEYDTSNITGHYFRIEKRYFTASRRNTQNYSDLYKEIEKQFNL